MSQIWQYLLGVSQNMVAPWISTVAALTLHHRWKVAPLMRALAEAAAKECPHAEEART